MESDGSSAISETRRSEILIRDGGVCVLCGDDPVDVAHIVARTAGDIGQVTSIRNMASSLGGFRKDDAPNLLCLCCSHYRQYDSGYFVFVPSKAQRDELLNHEHRDFAHRELLVTNGLPDPGRTLPDISDEVEYIPIRARQFRAYVHNPTRYDQTMFLFDTVDHYPCPLLHFRAAPICLMVQALPHLASGVRIMSDKANVAQLQIATLLELYQRQPGGGDDHITVPASYSSMATMMQPNTHPSARILPTIPSSPPPFRPSTSAPSMPYNFNLHPEVSGLTPSSSASTEGASEDTEVDLDMDAGTDLQLLGYTKEPAVTWEDLKSRPPLYPGEEGGYYQFSSAEQVIRGEWR